MKKTEEKIYPVGAAYYELMDVIGKGGCATVYRACCLPLGEIVAIKVANLEEQDDFKLITKEAQTMKLVRHPNLVSAYCSFIEESELWVVMPLMDAGSCYHVMKSTYPGSIQEEAVIAKFLYEALKGLEYLHRNGLMHRDVKAGNILVDSSGVVKLGDLGFSTSLFDSGCRRRRKTILGTPCWMAPEVIEQSEGYDHKADIWSFGITALELAHGRAPLAQYPLLEVFFKIIQEEPPRLDSSKKFSKSFKEIVAMCLVKDPSKRPTATELLKHPFFKNRKPNLRSVLEKLSPTLRKRLITIKTVAVTQDKMEETSQNEYKRGISCWDFNLEEIKAQAALLEDDVVEEERIDVLGRKNEGQVFQQAGQSNVMSEQVILDKVLPFDIPCGKSVMVNS
ncbi:hypothetical protein IFM89_010916 [Coptis chinensis]|uniref:Protein kinase domain-containing protein n=1 Tax=Coptis chinensis TaxID=261450 RepID=A0A835ILY9_9MAGN|nr:hypothetical protein IFM89_010916 [Coptis chinensis]